MEPYSVYILTYPDDDFYIGFTKDVDRRMLGHMSPSQNCVTAQKSEQYSRDEVDMNIVFSTNDINEAISVEGKLINTFYDFKHCLNRENPIGKSTKISEKISAKLKKRHKQGYYDNSYGKNLAEAKK